MEEALITWLSVVSWAVGLVGLYFLWEGIENMLVSSKMSCGTNGTIFLEGWLSVYHSLILYRLMFGTIGTILLKKRHSVFYFF
jgi:hypothetical protein